jgi:hypothetical protein
VRAFFKVTLPLSAPGLVAGTLLTFIPAAGDYVNAELLGSTTTHMLGNSIQSLFLKVGSYPAGGGAVVRPDGRHHDPRAGVRPPRGHRGGGLSAPRLALDS